MSNKLQILENKPTFLLFENLKTYKNEVKIHKKAKEEMRE